MLEPVPRRALAIVACIAIGTTMACGDSADQQQDRPGKVDNSTTTTAPRPTGNSSTTTVDVALTVEVVLSDGQVQGGPRRESVELGQRIRIRAVSDVSEELHVHTYDERVALQPGQAAEVVFTAHIPGRHEVEFEKSGRQALTLEVG